MGIFLHFLNLEMRFWGCRKFLVVCSYWLLYGNFDFAPMEFAGNGHAGVGFVIG